MNIRLAAVALLACARLASANTISSFNFNTLVIGQTYTSTSADIATTGNVAISKNSTFTASGGSSVFAVGGALPGNCLAMRSNAALNGSSLTFNFLDVSGFTNLMFGYATQRSSGGFTSQSLAYDINNTGTFLHLADVIPPSTYFYESFDLSKLPNVANAKTLSIQMTFTGSTADGEVNRLDNVQLNGDPVATPAAVPLPPAILGGAALLGVRAFKRRRQ